MDSNQCSLPLDIPYLDLMPKRRAWYQVPPSRSRFHFPSPCARRSRAPPLGYLLWEFPAVEKIRMAVQVVRASKSYFFTASAKALNDGAANLNGKRSLRTVIRSRSRISRTVWAHSCGDFQGLKSQAKTRQILD